MKLPNSPALRSFLGTSALFLLPAVAFLAVLELATPIEWATFRSWESVRVRQSLGILPGPFYPNRDFARTEVGDLTPHGVDRVEKSVDWTTDAYGYRTHNRALPVEIVIVGDSMTAGSSLGQSETLAAVLESELGVGVYPYAPSGPGPFLDDPRFLENPPEVVVLQRIERRHRLGIVRVPGGRRQSTNAALQRAATIADRLFFKRPMLQSLRSAVRRSLHPEATYNAGRLTATGDRMYFLEGLPAVDPVHEQKIPALVDEIVGLQSTLAARGIYLIYLPIPNKESIYADLLPGESGRQATYIPALVQALEQAGVPTLDTQAVFLSARSNDPGQLLYHTDDTHWTARGVRLIAAELATLIP